MNQNNGSVPPLPPRRTISSMANDFQTSIDSILERVPPPPSPSHCELMNFTTKESENNFNNNSFTTVNNAKYSAFSYMSNMNNSFTNYTYSASAAGTPERAQQWTLTNTSNASLAHSLSVPNFGLQSNMTYTYSTPPLFQNRRKVELKEDNCDLIDLVDHSHEEDKDVLQLFDPLLNYQTNTDLNFSNNFVDQSFEASDQLDRVLPQQQEEALAHFVRRDEEEITRNESTNGTRSAFRVVAKRYRANEELLDFCRQLVTMRSQYKANDFHSNVGLVISPTLDITNDRSLSVKLVIETQLLAHSPTPTPTKPQVVSFTCNVDTSVEHIISHVICTLVEDASQVQMDDYMLKVYGLEEYLAADSLLTNYSYVHTCHKFDKDVHLSLVHVKDLRRVFARTLKDDNNLDFTIDDLLPKSIVCKFGDLSAETINILLENFDREIEKLRSEARTGNQLQSQSIVQSVKAICSHLSSLETIPLTESYTNFSQLCNAFGVYKRESGSVTPSEGFPVNSLDKKIKAIPDLDSKLWEILEHALLKLRNALTQVIRLYAKTFPVNFELTAEDKPKPKKDISSSMDTLLLYVGVCVQLHCDWLSLYKDFKLRFDLRHGDHHLSTYYSKSVSPSKAFFTRLVFDEWLSFDCPLFSLPREVRLEVTLIGCKSVESVSTAEGVRDAHEMSADLAIGFMHLFDFRSRLSEGSYLMPLWTNCSDFCIESDRQLINSLCSEKTNPIVELAFPETEFEIRFPAVVWDQNCSTIAPEQRNRLNSLDSATQTELFQLLSANPLEPLSCGDREQLWDRRHYLYDCAEALPKVLLAAHSWDWTSLAAIYSMVEQWTPLSAIDSMQLLLASFPDIHVRQMAVKWLKKLSSDELCDFLPQLVQSLRFDAYIDCPLIWFLLESSLTSVRVCHHLYWTLKCNINDSQFAFRARVYLNSLLAICGEPTNQMFDRQERLCRHISMICDHVKAAKEPKRLSTLLVELEAVHDYLMENSTPLPLSPSMHVSGLDVKLCSYFPSNSLPLKLVFRTSAATSSLSSLEAIFKVGDDLRQDMLSMQMIQIMDKVWLKAGLDLRIVTFGCIATDVRKGMVEMVANSETLRKIQSIHGLTGSFKDRPIAEWLQKHNTSELEYRHAVNNFTYSCAGYSVATYILGICDRHNDNIMLTTSGHLFHIDFGKFLGDSQMMAGIKRDRVAFVLTQDMAYVINGGDRPSKQFQFFIDLCCQAFNLLRKNGNFLLSLFSLMTSSRICGLNADALKYIHRALMPAQSESEAMSQFTRMIEESLRSRFTQFNFFIHNLAQLRFTGDHNDQLLLSFVPKKFTKESDGEISRLEVMDTYKKYESNEKIYYYVIRVERSLESDPTFVHRTYREFLEFHDKISSLFPLAKFRILPRTSNLAIRSNTKLVALQRMQELNNFLSGLMQLAHEISHGDIVYTFFHPLLRDQEVEGLNPRILHIMDINSVNNNDAARNQTLFERNRRESLYGPAITGQIKLSLVYKNMSLVVMVMHAKNLQARSSTPDSYVKTYLLPDPQKASKRKTRVVPKSSHPTFMEMIVYHGIPLEKLRSKSLQVSVWEHSGVTENQFMGATNISLRDFPLNQTETCDWFPLTPS